MMAARGGWCGLLALCALSALPVAAGVSVAVVGGGICGASAAHFLRQDWGKAAHITVYEKSDAVGGRVRSLQLTDEARVEAGASIYHEVNRYLRRFVTDLGLNTTRPYRRGRMGLYAGQDEDGGEGFQFETSRFQASSTLRLWWRYGGSGLRALDSAVESAAGRLDALYEILDSGVGFTDLSEVLERIGLFNETQTTLGSYLAEAGVPARLIQELVAGFTRNNYGQAPDRINALAGLVAVKGADRKGLYAVSQGNEVLVRQLMATARARLRLRHPVTQIRRTKAPAPPALPPSAAATPAGRWAGGRRTRATPTPQPAPAAPVEDPEGWEVVTADGEVTKYDAVVLCTPLANANIRLPDAVAKRWPAGVLAPPLWPTHATFIQGRLRPEPFGEYDTDDLPATILTTENASLPFNSIGRYHLSLCPLTEKPAADCPKAPVYKVFSRTALTKPAVDALFTDVTYQHAIPWEAYPRLEPTAELPPVVLAKGLYYPNSLEAVVSTMETQIIAARNAANLLAADFQLVRAPAAAAPRDPDADAAEL